MGGAGIHTGAAALAEFGVHIEPGQGQAGPGGTFLAADMGGHFALKGVQGRQHRQGGFLAQGAVAGGGHHGADLPGQVQVPGPGAAGGHVLHNTAQLVQPFAAEGALAAALGTQGGEQYLGLVHGALGVGQAAQHAGTPGRFTHRLARQLVGVVKHMPGHQALAVPDQFGHGAGRGFFHGQGAVHRYQHAGSIPQQPVGQGSQLIQGQQPGALVGHLVHEGGPGNGQFQVHQPGVGFQLLGVQVLPHHQHRIGGAGQYRGDLQARHHSGGVGVEQNVLHAVGVGIIQGAHHPGGGVPATKNGFQGGLVQPSQPVQGFGVVLQKAHCAAPSFSSV